MGTEGAATKRAAKGDVWGGDSEGGVGGAQALPQQREGI